MIRILKSTHKPAAHFYAQAARGLEEVLSDKAYGFWQVPSRTAAIPEIEKQAKRLQQWSGPLFLFGVGGSSLGPQLIGDLYQTPSRQIVVCDNLDPIMLARQWGKPESMKQASFVFISKSGSTLETLATLQKLSEFLKPVDAGWTQRTLVISEDKKNPLTDWAQASGVPVLPMPIDVGGRFSVLTSVGMLSASYLGQQVSEFHQGAQWALKQSELHQELVAQSLASFERNEWVSLFWSYSSMLRYFNSWIIQLWAESLAKKVDKKGASAPRVSTPWTAVGATDQHSLLQQVMEGARDKFVFLIQVKDLKTQMPFQDNILFPHLSFLKGQSMGQILSAEATAISGALSQVGVPLIELELQDLSARSMGAWLMTWQIVVAGLGTSLGLNPFDQPGVELGKRLALEILNP